MISYRRTTGRHDDVRARRRAKAVGYAVQVVGEQADVDDLRACVRQQGGEHDAVGGGDLTRSQRFADRAKFIARANDGDARPAPDGKAGVTRHGGERDLRRADPATCFDQGSAHCEVGRAGPDIAPRVVGSFAGEVNMIPVDRRFLLHQHGVGPLRHGRTSENPHRLALCQGHGGRRSASARLPHALPWPRQIDMADRIAVHRGKIGPWLVAQGCQGFGQIAATHREKVGPLDGQRRRQCEQAGLCLLDRQEVHGAVQSPDFPPRFSVTRIWPMTIVLSMAFNIS